MAAVVAGLDEGGCCSVAVTCCCDSGVAATGAASPDVDVVLLDSATGVGGTFCEIILNDHGDERSSAQNICYSNSRPGFDSR